MQDMISRFLSVPRRLLLPLFNARTTGRRKGSSDARRCATNHAIHLVRESFAQPCPPARSLFRSLGGRRENNSAPRTIQVREVRRYRVPRVKRVRNSPSLPLVPSTAGP